MAYQRFFPKYLFPMFVTLLLAVVPSRVYRPAAASLGVDRVPVVADSPVFKQGDALDEAPTDQIIIKYEASADLSGIHAPAHPNRMRALSAVAGVQLEYFREMSGDAHVLRLPGRAPLPQVRLIADRLMTLADVEYAEPDGILRHALTPNDPLYSSQWHYFEAYGINAPAAWDITTGSSGLTIAVIDTGTLNHADLSGRTVVGYDFITSAFVANDGDGRDSDPSDPGDWSAAGECGPGSLAKDSSWHGTHVAGTIGAASNNGIGVAGVNWNSRILPIRVLGKCGGLTSDIVDGMRWAAGLSVPGVPANANPAKVLNLSLEGSGACGLTYQSAIDAITAAGATVVVAAGNSNIDAINVRPANCNGVITAAATDRSGNKASYSNYGSVVEISAPGGSGGTGSPNAVLSTLNSGTTVPVSDIYEYYNGTSMAAPHVAGVASLLYSLSPSLTPSQVARILTTTITAFPVGSSCNTSICGAGIVNAGAAVNTLPRIAGMSPVMATTGGPTFTMIITGANFASGATAKWNGSNRATQFLSSTQLSVTISAADIAVSGNYSLSVTSNHATYGTITTAARTFLVQGPMSERVYLPLIVRNWPPIPPAPVLNAINNADGDGAYNVTWNASSTATSYTLEEDDNSSFSSPTAVYSGSGLLWVASGKAGGTYYYRVKATNSYGDSAWSNVQSVTVSPQSGPTPGFWESQTGDEFYVSPDRANVLNFAIYVSVSGCGTYKITRLTPAPISNNSFSFSGTFYASGTFDTSTSAHGTDGLSNHYIFGCGYVSGGPWNWTATWQNSSQPTIDYNIATPAMAVHVTTPHAAHPAAISD